MTELKAVGPSAYDCLEERRCLILLICFFASTLIRIDPLMLINTDPLIKCLIARAIARFSYQPVNSKAFYIKLYLYLLSSIAWVSFS